jgi:hypothetical protein
MKMLKKIKTVPKNASGTLRPGWFGVKLIQHCSKKSVPYFQWYSCRDSFQNILTKDIEKGLFFVHNGIENTINFMQYLEKQLKLKTGSVYAKTDNDKVIWFKPDSFWTSSLLRRSFMTLMMRCSLNYKNSDIKAAIETHENARHCMPAINRFLSGATLYRNQRVSNLAKGARGWCYLFSDKDSRQVGQLLMKPVE